MRLLLRCTLDPDVGPGCVGDGLSANSGEGAKRGKIYMWPLPVT